MDNIPLDWKKIRTVLVAIAAVLGLLLGVINYITPQLPGGEIQALGVTNFDNLTLSGDLNAENVNATTITATTIVSQAVEFAGTDATLSGDVTAGTLAVGGGYGDTGCTLSAAGVLQCNGATTTDGALTAGSAVIGGGYGSTGCTLSAAGVLQCNGAATIDGALTNNGFAFSGAVRGGTSATYTSGAAITHGFASAPNWCLMGPARDVTSTLTIGATTFSSDMASVATPIYWVCGK